MAMVKFLIIAILFSLFKIITAYIVLLNGFKYKKQPPEISLMTV